MDSYRRQKGGEIHHQEIQGTRSQNRKPPSASWQPTVPSWEKKFCSSVGSISWKKVLETKRFMYLYDNVVQWDDSAGEEAFHNAKNRFWAEINGIPCDIALPDPDIYIDEIDWNSDIGPELLLDLEEEPKVPDEIDKDENGVILSNSLLLNQSFSCTGWGDAEEDLQKDTNLFLGPGNGDCDHNVDNNKNSWEGNSALNNGAVKDDGWGNCWNDSGGWNQWEGNNNDWDYNYNESKNAYDRTGGDWGTWDSNGRKREGAGWSMSRYKTSRFHGDDYHTHRGWRNGRGRKRSNFACDRPHIDEKPSSKQWNSMNYCGPAIPNDGFSKAGIPWSWDKRVL